MVKPQQTENKARKNGNGNSVDMDQVALYLDFEQIYTKDISYMTISPEFHQHLACFNIENNTNFPNKYKAKETALYTPKANESAIHPRVSQFQDIVSIAEIDGIPTIIINLCAPAELGQTYRNTDIPSWIWKYAYEKQQMIKYRNADYSDNFLMFNSRSEYKVVFLMKDYFIRGSLPLLPLLASKLRLDNLRKPVNDPIKSPYLTQTKLKYLDDTNILKITYYTSCILLMFMTKASEQIYGYGHLDNTEMVLRIDPGRVDYLRDICMQHLKNEISSHIVDFVDYIGELNNGKFEILAIHEEYRKKYESAPNTTSNHRKIRNMDLGFVRKWFLDKKTVRTSLHLFLDLVQAFGYADTFPREHETFMLLPSGMDTHEYDNGNLIRHAEYIIHTYMRNGKDLQDLQYVGGGGNGFVFYSESNNYFYIADYPSIHSFGQRYDFLYALFRGSAGYVFPERFKFNGDFVSIYPDKFFIRDRQQYCIKLLRTYVRNISRIGHIFRHFRVVRTYFSADLILDLYNDDYYADFRLTKYYEKTIKAFYFLDENDGRFYSMNSGDDKILRDAINAMNNLILHTPNRSIIKNNEKEPLGIIVPEHPLNEFMEYYYGTIHDETDVLIKRDRHKKEMDGKLYDAMVMLFGQEKTDSMLERVFPEASMDMGMNMDFEEEYTIDKKEYKMENDQFTDAVKVNMVKQKKKNASGYLFRNCDLYKQLLSDFKNVNQADATNKIKEHIVVSEEMEFMKKAIRAYLFKDADLFGSADVSTKTMSFLRIHGLMSANLDKRLEKLKNITNNNKYKNDLSDVITSLETLIERITPIRANPTNPASFESIELSCNNLKKILKNHIDAHNTGKTNYNKTVIKYIENLYSRLYDLDSPNISVRFLRTDINMTFALEKNYPIFITESDTATNLVEVKTTSTALDNWLRYPLDYMAVIGSNPYLKKRIDSFQFNPQGNIRRQIDTLAEVYQSSKPNQANVIRLFPSIILAELCKRYPAENLYQRLLRELFGKESMPSIIANHTSPPTVSYNDFIQHYCPIMAIALHPEIYDYLILPDLYEFQNGTLMVTKDQIGKEYIDFLHLQNRIPEISKGYYSYRNFLQYILVKLGAPNTTNDWSHIFKEYVNYKPKIPFTVIRDVYTSGFSSNANADVRLFWEFQSVIDSYFSGTAPIANLASLLTLLIKEVIPALDYTDTWYQFLPLFKGQVNENVYKSLMSLKPEKFDFGIDIKNVRKLNTEEKESLYEFSSKYSTLSKPEKEKVRIILKTVFSLSKNQIIDFESSIKPFSEYIQSLNRIQYFLMGLIPINSVRLKDLVKVIPQNNNNNINDEALQDDTEIQKTIKIVKTGSKCHFNIILPAPIMTQIDFELKRIKDDKSKLRHLYDTKKLLNRVLARKIFNIQRAQSMIYGTAAPERKMHLASFNSSKTMWNFISNQADIHDTSMQMNQDWYDTIRNYFASNACECAKFLSHFKVPIHYESFFQYLEENANNHPFIRKKSMVRNGFRALRNSQNRSRIISNIISMELPLLGKFLNREKALRFQKLMLGYLQSEFGSTNKRETDPYKKLMNKLLYRGFKANLIDLFFNKTIFNRVVYTLFKNDIDVLIKMKQGEILNPWSSLFGSDSDSHWDSFKTYAKEKLKGKASQIEDVNWLVYSKDDLAAFPPKLIYQLAYLYYYQEFLQKIHFKAQLSGKSNSDPPTPKDYKRELQVLAVLHVFCNCANDECDAILEDLYHIFPMSYSSLNPLVKDALDNLDLSNLEGYEEFNPYLTPTMNNDLDRGAMNAVINLSIGFMSLLLLQRKLQPNFSYENTSKKIESLMADHDALCKNLIAEWNEDCTIFETWINSDSTIPNSFEVDLDHFIDLNCDRIIANWAPDNSNRFPGTNHINVVDTIPLNKDRNAMGQVKRRKRIPYDVGGFPELNELFQKCKKHQIQRKGSIPRMPIIDFYDPSAITQPVRDVPQLESINLKNQEIIVKFNPGKILQKFYGRYLEIHPDKFDYFADELMPITTSKEELKRADFRFLDSFDSDFNCDQVVEDINEKLKQLVDTEISFLYNIDSVSSMPIFLRRKKLNAILGLIQSVIEKNRKESYIKGRIKIFRNLLACDDEDDHAPLFSDIIVRKINLILYGNEDPNNTQIYNFSNYSPENIASILNCPEVAGTEDEWKTVISVVKGIYDECKKIDDMDEIEHNYAAILYFLQKDLNDVLFIGTDSSTWNWNDNEGNINYLLYLEKILPFAEKEIRSTMRFIKKKQWIASTYTQFPQGVTRRKKYYRKFSSTNALSQHMILNYCEGVPLLYAQHELHQEYYNDAKIKFGYSDEQLEDLSTTQYTMYGKIEISKNLTDRICSDTCTGTSIASISVLRPKKNRSRVNLHLTLREEKEQKTDDDEYKSVTGKGTIVEGIDTNMLGNRTHSVAVIDRNKSYDENNINDYLRIEGDWKNLLMDHLKGFMSPKTTKDRHFVSFYGKLANLLENQPKPKDDTPYDIINTIALQPNKLDCLMAFSTYVVAKRNHLERHIQLNQRKIGKLRSFIRKKGKTVNRNIYKHIARVENENYYLHKRYSNLRKELTRYLEYTHKRIITEENVSIIAVERLNLSSEISGGLGRINSQIIYPEDVFPFKPVSVTKKKKSGKLRQVNPNYTSMHCYICNLQGRKSIVNRKYSSVFGICPSHGLIDAQYGAAVNISFLGGGNTEDTPADENGNKGLDSIG